MKKFEHMSQTAAAIFSLITEAIGRGVVRLFQLFTVAVLCATVILIIQSSELLQFFLGVLSVLVVIALIGWPKKWFV